MSNLPESICKLREIANTRADELQDAWENLNNIETPGLNDLEEWLEVKRSFYVAQEEFEKQLYQFLTSGLNA